VLRGIGDRSESKAKGRDRFGRYFQNLASRDVALGVVGRAQLRQASVQLFQVWSGGARHLQAGDCRQLWQVLAELQRRLGMARRRAEQQVTDGERARQRPPGAAPGSTLLNP